MEKNNFISEEFKEKMLDHSSKLADFLRTYKIYRYCIENEVYIDNRSEISSFGVILEKYFEKIKSDFQQINDECGIF